MIAPIRNVPHSTKPWLGSCKIKPSEYLVSCVVPVIDTYDSLALVIELLRLQTVKPLIMVIDTGSLPENLLKIQQLADEDVEVHSLRLNGVNHPSDFPCFAQDIAHAMCRSKYLFSTHSDVFLKKRNVLEEMVELCQDHPVVGYQITERPHKDWVGMVGHSCLMYDVSVIDSFGITWSMRRICDAYDVSWSPDARRGNWPDTEVGFNVLCREHGITPYIMGTEENFARNITEHFDHCRSLSGSLLYSADGSYHKQCLEWLESAKKDARERIALWRQEKTWQSVKEQYVKQHQSQLA